MNDRWIERLKEIEREKVYRRNMKLVIYIKAIIMAEKKLMESRREKMNEITNVG